MSRAIVTVTGWTPEGYSKQLATMSDVQIHMTVNPVREPAFRESVGKVGVVIDPKDFPEMDRFSVTVELIK